MSFTTLISSLPFSAKTGWPWTEETPLSLYDPNISYPKITIVTPNYNHGQFLEETIRSVLLQNYPNLEYIIIDGGSSDNSVNIIKKYEKWINYWISEPDGGIYQAMNKGIKYAKGVLIGNINSDDWYEQGALELAAKQYLKNKSTIIYGWMNIMNIDKYLYVMKYTHRGIKTRMFQHPTWFIPKKVFKKQGVYNEEFRIAADYEFACRLNSRQVKFFLIEQTLANHRVGGISYNIFQVTKEVLNIKLNYKYISKINYIFSLLLNYKSKILSFFKFLIKGIAGRK